MRPFLGLEQRISSGLALLFLLVLSSAVAFGTVRKGLEIAQMAEQSVESDLGERNRLLQEHLREKETRKKTLNTQKEPAN